MPADSRLSGDACPNCAEMAAEIRRLEDANRALGESEAQHADVIGDLERELRVKRATITKLNNQLEDKDADDPRMPEATELFEFWKQNCKPKAQKFKGKRRRAVLDRLRDGWQIGDLKDAILGAAAGAYVDEKGVKYDELELICRDDEHVGKFLKRYEAYRQRIGDAIQDTARPARRDPEPDLSRIWWMNTGLFWLMRDRIDSLEHALAGVVQAAGGDWPEKGSAYAPAIAVARATLGYPVPIAVALDRGLWAGRDDSARVDPGLSWLGDVPSWPVSRPRLALIEGEAA